jgi:hypothetical protein
VGESGAMRPGAPVEVRGMLEQSLYQEVRIELGSTCTSTAKLRTAIAVLLVSISPFIPAFDERIRLLRVKRRQVFQFYQAVSPLR